VLRLQDHIEELQGQVRTFRDDMQGQMHALRDDRSASIAHKGENKRGRETKKRESGREKANSDRDRGRGRGRRGDGDEEDEERERGRAEERGNRSSSSAATAAAELTDLRKELHAVQEERDVFLLEGRRLEGSSLAFAALNSYTRTLLFDCFNILLPSNPSI